MKHVFSIDQGNRVFDNDNDNGHLLFHGTRKENLRNIFTNGFQIFPSDGSNMFGDGSISPIGQVKLLHTAMRQNYSRLHIY